MPLATADGQKVCSACGLNQPVTSFYAQRSAADGRQSRCKTCQVSGPPANRPSVHGQVRFGTDYLADADRMKRCRVCEVRQPVTEFHNRWDQPDERCPYCRSCKRAEYAANSEQARAKEAAHRREHRDEINARRRARLNDPAARQEANARRRARRAADPEPDRAACRQWRADHADELNARRRARRARTGAAT